MSTNSKFSQFGFATRAVYAGNDIDKDSGAIKRPITMANSYALPYDPTDMNWSSAAGNLYTRNGSTNQKYLQERLASLEDGEDCVVLASGVAALSGLFFALLNQSDHVIFSSVTYIAVYRLLNELFNNNRFVSRLKIITSAVSLGHAESLIVFLGENDERQYLYPEEFHNGFFRFSVGIEDVDDIIADLRQAMEQVGLL